MKTMFWIIGLLVIAVIAFYLFRKGKVADSNPASAKINYGPFVVQADAFVGKSLDLNAGIVKYTNVSYSVWYKDKPIAFPAALQTNTGLPFLWRVYVLADAPEPTLIAGSQSLYLIYLQNGKPVVEPVREQSTDFATLQFLDSEQGQPGVFQEVFSKSDVSDISQLDTLKGGRYLLVSGHTVLDVETLKMWVFNKNNEPMDNYSFPQPKQALAFSPDKKKIVFNGSFQSWNTEESKLPDSEHAIVVYDFETDQGYSVLYDDTDTRMKDMFSINRDWLNTYFQWNAEGVFTLKTWETLPPWTGSYKERDNYYYLYPVKASMLPVFQDFVLAQMGWNQKNILQDTSAEYSGRTIQLGSGDTKLDIVFKEDDQTISLSKHLYDTDSPEYRALVQKLAAAFDAELLSGKHQEHFGRIVSQTKRILSL